MKSKKGKSRRKQQLSSRLEQTENNMTAESDPFLVCDIQDENMSFDPFISPNVTMDNITDNLILPVDLSAGSSLDMCPTSDLVDYTDDLVDMNNILRVMDFDPCNLFLDDSTEENVDVIRGARCTSTPKSRPAESTTRHESPKKRSHYHVLHDITDSLNSANNESFINISHILNTPRCHSASSSDAQKMDHLTHLYTPPSSKSKKTFKQSPGRTVRIIRKKLSLRSLEFPTPEQSSASEIVSSDCPSAVVEETSQETPALSTSEEYKEEELVYYSGVNSYDICVKLLKHMKLPTSQDANLTVFKMQMIVLMKIRLDLEWKDIGFRYGFSDQVVRSVFHRTLSVFSESLAELLPWHANKRSRRINPKTLYVYAVKRHVCQVVLILGDGRKPVYFVSNMYSGDEHPLAIIFNDCEANIIKGDVLYINDQYFRVTEENGTLDVEGVDAVNRLCINSVTNMREVVNRMITTYPLQSFEPHVDLTKILITVSALTNLNYMPSVSTNTLRLIFERSAEMSLGRK